MLTASKKHKGKLSILISILTIHCTRARVYAYSWVGNNKGSNDKIDELTETAEGMFGSSYGIVNNIAITSLAIGFMIAGIKFVGGAKSRAEAKEKLIKLIIGGIAVFGMMTILSIVIKIGKSL